MWNLVHWIDLSLRLRVSSLLNLAGGYQQVEMKYFAYIYPLASAEPFAYLSY